jgi:hypothetical protein
MTCTVSDIIAQFHNFSNTEECVFVRNRACKKKGRALLLATVNLNERQHIQKRIGIESESAMLDLYETCTGCRITHRNDQTYSMMLNNVKIYGKVDGIVVEDGILIEHKRRIHGFLNKVPYHERVQCFLYMKMTNLTKSHLVESFGKKIQIHEILFDESIWQNICRRCVN